MTVDKLHMVKRVSRARALESFEFFANYVLGARVPSSLCESVQNRVENGEKLTHLEPKLQKALELWLALQKGESPSFKNDTFSWLFSEAA